MKFCVIGHPVGHSLSPFMHAANFRACGFDGTYEAFDLAPDRLDAELARLVAAGYRGLNVTIPHKRAVAACLDACDDSVRRADGAVNTIAVSESGHTTGYNTDVAGFLADLRAKGFEPAGRRILICGAGGLGRALYAGLTAAGAGDVALANRTPRTGVTAFDAPACRAFAAEADLIVNATALGLKADDPAVLPPEWFRANQFVYDCAPVRHETATLRAARQAGARCADGLGMLVRQGAEAFRIWTGRAADPDAMERAVRTGVESMHRSPMGCARISRQG